MARYRSALEPIPDEIKIPLIKAFEIFKEDLCYFDCS